MKITKYGHCCMLIEEQGVRILTDPGEYSDGQNQVEDVDLIIITHEHSDHFHIESIKNIISNNPNVKIVTNGTVSELLKDEGINNFEIVEDGNSTEVNGIKIEAYGTKHEQLFRTIEASSNTGFFIGTRLFYPGDAFTDPNKSVDILALPVAGPWLNIQQAIDYALKIKPKVAIPVHDGILKAYGGSHIFPNRILPENGINFMVLELEKEYEI